MFSEQIFNYLTIAVDDRIVNSIRLMNNPIFNNPISKITLDQLVLNADLAYNTAIQHIDKCGHLPFADYVVKLVYPFSTIPTDGVGSAMERLTAIFRQAQANHIGYFVDSPMKFSFSPPGNPLTRRYCCWLMQLTHLGPTSIVRVILSCDEVTY